MAAKKGSRGRLFQDRAVMPQCRRSPAPMTSPARNPEPSTPRRNIAARALDQVYALLDANQERRSPGRQLVSLLLLLSAVLGVPGGCLTLAQDASKDVGLLILLLIPVWLVLVFVGAVGHGLRCPRCGRWWSRKTGTYTRTDGPVATERIASVEEPGTLDLVRRRSVSWSGTYCCKRCGHGWSKEGSGEHVSR